MTEIDFNKIGRIEFLFQLAKRASVGLKALSQSQDAPISAPFAAQWKPPEVMRDDLNYAIKELRDVHGLDIEKKETDNA